MFIPITSVQNAELLSRRLWDLVMPPEHRQTDAVARYLVPWFVHPETGAVVVQMPTHYDIPVHAAADAGPIKELMLPFVELGVVTEQEIDDAIAAVHASRGQRVVVYDLFPSYWQSLAMTREQVEAAGWFPELVISGI